MTSEGQIIAAYQARNHLAFTMLAGDFPGGLPAAQKVVRNHLAAFSRKARRSAAARDRSRSPSAATLDEKIFELRRRELQLRYELLKRRFGGG